MNVYTVFHYDNNWSCISKLFSFPVPLVRQQAKVVSDCTDLVIGQYFGMEIDKWTKEEWVKEIENHQVLVMTPDILKMVLLHGFMPLSSLNLIIFDECHRAVKNHAYCQIMECFDVCVPECQPQILGLSASLLNSKCQPSKIEKEILCLERNLRSSVETASELTSLSKYGSKPKEYLVEYCNFFENEPNVISIMSNINNALVFLDNVNISYESYDDLSHPCRQPRRYLVEVAHVIVSLGPWCTLTAAQLFIEEINNVLQSLFSTPHIQFLVLARTVLLIVEKQCQTILNGQDLLHMLINSSPPKLKELLKILEPYKPDVVPSTDENQTSNAPESSNENNVKVCPENQSNNNIEQNSVTGNDQEVNNVAPSKMTRSERRLKYSALCDDGKALCGLIFVQQRIIAYLLSEWLSMLKELHPDFTFLSPSYIIGHGKTNSGAKSILMGFQKQEEVLQKFRTKIYNLVVATSVVEEGMDIPKCNLVIRFDPPENFRAYVQSKGRARVNESLYVLMVNSKEKESFVDMLCDFKTVEEVRFSMQLL